MYKAWFAALILLVGGCTTFTEINVPALPQKAVWVDFDPACRKGTELKDPDDCIAYHALSSSGLRVLGYSTVSGNASEAEVWRTAQELVPDSLPLYRSSRACDGTLMIALRDAAVKHKLTILALGPLTNIARFIECFPKALDGHDEIVFVGGRRPNATLIANPEWMIGIALRDLNVETDIKAVHTVLRSGVRLHYVPFEASLGMTMSFWELSSTTLPDPLLERVRDWSLLFTVFFGTEGMLPFDPAAVAFVLWPNEFVCEPTQADLRGRELVAELAEGDAGDSTYCLPKDPKRVKALILSVLRRPL